MPQNHLRSSCNVLFYQNTFTYLLTDIFSASSSRAEYCDEHVRVSVCLRTHLKNHTSKLYRSYFCACNCLWSLIGVAIRYVFPVLWMTSCFP